MRRLFDIDEDIENAIDPETGEVNEESLNALLMEKDKKIENILLYLKDMRAEISALMEEIAIFTKRKQALEKKREKIHEWLQGYLAGEKFKTPKVMVYYQSSKETVIDDLNQIPLEFLKFSEPTADRTAIKKAIDEGEEITGAHIETKSNMIIK